MKEFHGGRGLIFNEPPIFEKGRNGRKGCDWPKSPFPDKDLTKIFDGAVLRETLEGFPEVSEPEVVRHFTRLSQWNVGVDGCFYPLGSCTMKYNPKAHEKAARLEGFSSLHPLQPPETAQPPLRVMYELEKMLCEITGMYAGTLQPAAGAQGELAGLMLIRARLEERGNPRKKVILPDSAHGTNPASATLCDYESITLHSGTDGLIDLADLERLVDDQTAALMLTNPNTLGLFEKNIKQVCEIVHKKGGLVYGDGANLNAILGKSRFGDMGIDVCHLNLHKTFSTPHGGGGPGAGPVLCIKELAPYLPAPRVIKTDNGYDLDYDMPEGIGAIHAFYGNFGVLLKAYLYILSLGSEGLNEISDAALFNANYILSRLRGSFHVPYDADCMHECIVTDKIQNAYGVTTLDMAKALIDRGFHPPTVYFPLIVKGAMMIEPTESETKETLDAFIDAMIEIAELTGTDPESIKRAPEFSKVKRLDETSAARKPDLRF
ncbi:MAG: putative glycine dehydrogenase (decarboxylating) subunit 2 [bacterium]|nr:MAG: putative glycine dehydrogenase (decarboxylating) subunit 2 [bacterium]